MKSIAQSKTRKYLHFKLLINQNFILNHEFQDFRILSHVHNVRIRKAKRLNCYERDGIFNVVLLIDYSSLILLLKIFKDFDLLFLQDLDKTERERSDRRSGRSTRASNTHASNNSTTPNSKSKKSKKSKSSSKKNKYRSESEESSAESDSDIEYIDQIHLVLDAILDTKSKTKHFYN